MFAKGALVISYGINELGHHWIIKWLVTCSVPSHLPEPMLICCKLERLQGHLINIQWFSFKKMHLKMSTKWCPYPDITVNTLRPRQNGPHFPDDIFKCLFLNENVWISKRISLKFVSEGPINNIPALVQKMAWRRPGAKPLSAPMLVSLLTHICVTRPKWVNKTFPVKAQS